MLNAYIFSFNSLLMRKTNLFSCPYVLVFFVINWAYFSSKLLVNFASRKKNVEDSVVFGITISGHSLSFSILYKELLLFNETAPDWSTRCSANYLSRVMRKPDFCLGENKGADQLRGNREADQRLCFRYSDSTIPLLSKSKISSF